MQSVAALRCGQKFQGLQHAQGCGPSVASLLPALWPGSSHIEASRDASQTLPRVSSLATRNCSYNPSSHGRTTGLCSATLHGSQQSTHICNDRQGQFNVGWPRTRRSLLCRRTAVATLAQEEWSSSQGTTEEARHSSEEHADSLGETAEGPVIIGVRECADGSVIFDFGEAAERPEHDPLDAFVRGATSEEAGPADSPPAGVTPEATTVGGVQEGDLLIAADASSRDVSTSSENGGTIDSSSTSLRLNSGGVSLPHPAKVQKGGEDAFFCSEHGNTSYVGVSDGVGGWATLGIDAGLYSRELMYHCQRMASENILPRSMLIRAHKLTKATGSATAMVARLRGSRLRVANLGDSGFLLVRDGEVALASTQMQHAFNFPFQIGSKGGDDPDCAKDYEVEVERGDLLILGTDGLFDNLFEKEIAEAAAMLMSKGVKPQLASQHIAAFAQQRSLLKGGLSPFAVQADAAGYKHLGGKPDDITVVVAYIEWY